MQLNKTEHKHALYVQVIVDITSGNLDKTFQYRIPSHLQETLSIGACVQVPFGKGNRVVNAYVLDMEEKPVCDPAKIKEVLGLSPEGVSVEGHLIALAGWMKQQYGSAMITCLKTVLPAAQKSKPVVRKEISRQASAGEYLRFLGECKRKKQKARVRLLEAIPENQAIPYELVTQKLHITASVVNALTEKGMICVEEITSLRNPVSAVRTGKAPITLNEVQLQALDELRQEAACPVDEKRPCLLYGITGSGKTEVYMELIQDTIDQGKQAILLIPEIALTYQTVLRFYERFGDRVSFIHSRLSAAERYDQYQRAKQGEIDLMIGPRSALFTPFDQLGLIIIDEEHEGAYKSETTPRYHARDVAIKRAQMTGSTMILGSATPSIESAYYAQNGTYRLVRMNKRAKENAVLPKVSIVDMRKELTQGNKSMFSRLLYEKIRERLQKKEQIMLFLNRRGYENFISCRSCGEALRCPHCDVSLTLHKNGRLYCHYCGYSVGNVRQCPSCGSPYIAGFGIGTEKVEEKLKELFPEARILRMDLDTTKGKRGHEQILAAFANEEADILVGTQMIVKGHDFPKVTLVSALAADTSLFASDFRACERTFQLLTQAAGRAGRDEIPGEMIIQTYKPDQYSIVTAGKQDYNAYYKEEIGYRRLLHYPPFVCMTEVIFSGRNETAVREGSQLLADMLRGTWGAQLTVLGPTVPKIGKINDIYYYHLYLRTKERETMNRAIAWAGEQIEPIRLQKNILIQFDLL